MYPLMKKQSLAARVALFVGFLWLGFGAYAQTPSDGLMMEKGDLCAGVVYNYDVWDHYWEGDLYRTNGNIGSLRRQTVMPMFALGIGKHINLIGALPWMQVDATAGTLDGVRGFQDAGIWLKGLLADKQLGEGSLRVFGVVGYAGPASRYLPDYMPLSLGLGCREGMARAIVQYDRVSGWYLRSQAAFHLRSHCTIERIFYYANGQPHYTNKVDVPNALSWDVVAGAWLLGRALRAEARLEGMNSLSGDDIRRQLEPFPTNRMIATRLGLFGQYYYPRLNGLSFIVQGGYVLTGRNVGRSASVGVGALYQFGAFR
jgi:hypothetical protein